MARYTAAPAARVEGALRVPGDKSVGHRAVMIAAAGHGRTLITGLSGASDLRATIGAVESLGVAVLYPQGKDEGQIHGPRRLDWQILVDGKGLDGWSEPVASIDCANSGTTMRTLAGFLAGRLFSTTLTGDESLRRRPMERIAGPLRRMGATLRTNHGRPPIEITGARLAGCEHLLEVASSQVKTAVCFAGLQADGTTTIVEPQRSRDHTERMLEYLGVPVERSENRLIIKSIDIQNASEIDIPGDISSAAFLLVAAAMLPGSDVTVTGVGVNPTRTGILEILRRFGADVEIADEVVACGEPRASVRVRASDRRPLRIEAADVPAALDELPLVAVLGAVAEGTTVVSGAAELRVKESDRIAAVCAGLRALGIDIEPAPDGFIVRGGRQPSGGEVDAAGDHRIAMSLAVAGLAAAGPVTIHGWEAVDISYPGFEQDLASLAVPVSGSRPGRP